MRKGSRDVAFMQKNPEADDANERASQLHSIVDRMLAPFGKTSRRDRQSLLSSSEPFDTSKPNEHDSKAEFQRELAAVKGSHDNLRTALNLLAPMKPSEENREMLERLRPILDQKLRNQASQERVGDVLELIRKNAAEVGGFTASFLVLLDLWLVLSDRHSELLVQEEKFWNVSHRPPNHYARTIALRLAKLYARETGQRPTIGTSGVSGEPSTTYSQAVKETFELLGITSDGRSPTEWAVAKLTDDDLKPPVNALANFSGSGAPRPYSRSVMDVVREMDEKRSGP